MPGPGDKVTYSIATKDQSGKPVSADVSLAVVDKAVLALAPSNSDPILKGFYPDTGLGVQTALGLVSSADDFNAQYRNSIPTGGGAGGGGGNDNSLGIITVRQDLKIGILPGTSHNGCKWSGASNGYAAAEFNDMGCRRARRDN